MSYRVAVVGATGAVGHEMLQTLAEREFPVDEVAAVASSRSAGKEVSFGDAVLTCRDLETFDFRGWNVALFSPGGEVSGRYAPGAAEAGAMVIDNTSRFRYDDDVPLVVPEVNAHHLDMAPRRNIVANPELLDDPDGGRPQAATRPRPHPAHCRLHLPGHGRRRKEGHG